MGDKGQAQGKINFTKRSLEAIETPKDKRVVKHDAQTRGLAFLIQANGTPEGHRYFFWFRKVQGRPRWETIGDFPELSVENARAAAARLNTQLAEWKARGYPGRNPFEKSDDPTLGSLAQEYRDKHLENHAKNPERAKSFAKQIFEAHLSHWKNRKLSSITRQNVNDLHDSVRKTTGPYAANRVVQDLRAVINWALRGQRWDGENPAIGIQPFEEKPRQRYLSEDETKKLIDALDTEPNHDLADFVALAAFTGMRKSDITSARWIGEDGQAQINFETRSWFIPRPKNDVPYTVALAPQAIEILKRRKNASKESPWVFPSHSSVGHVLDFKRAWAKFLTRAGIENLRQHDLRHNLASVQINQGASLKIVGGSLGHESVQATQRYAHLQLSSVRASVETAVTHMLTAGREQTPAPGPKKARRRRAKTRTRRKVAARR